MILVVLAAILVFFTKLSIVAIVGVSREIPFAQ